MACACTSSLAANISINVPRCTTLRMRNACNYFGHVALSWRCHFQLSRAAHTASALTAFELFLECINERRTPCTPCTTTYPAVQCAAVSAVRIKWNKTKSKLKRCRCQRSLSSLAVPAEKCERERAREFPFLYFRFVFVFGFSFCLCFCNKVEFGTSVGCS